MLCALRSSLLCYYCVLRMWCTCEAQYLPQWGVPMRNSRLCTTITTIRRVPPSLSSGHSVRRQLLTSFRCLPICNQLWKMTPFSNSVNKTRRLPSTGYLRAQIEEEAHPVTLRPWNSEKDLKRDIIGHANQVWGSCGRSPTSGGRIAGNSQTAEMSRTSVD